LVLLAQIIPRSPSGRPWFKKRIWWGAATASQRLGDTLRVLGSRVAVTVPASPERPWPCNARPVTIFENPQ